MFTFFNALRVFDFPMFMGFNFKVPLQQPNTFTLFLHSLNTGTCVPAFVARIFDGNRRKFNPVSSRLNC